MRSERSSPGESPSRTTVHSQREREKDWLTEGRLSTCKQLSTDNQLSTGDQLSTGNQLTTSDQLSTINCQLLTNCQPDIKLQLE